MARPGSMEIRGTLMPSSAAVCRDDLGHRRGKHGRFARGVGLGVGDAVAAAQIQLGQLDAVVLLDPGQEAQHLLRGQGEALGLEDLRADVRVQAQQVQFRVCQREGDGGGRGRNVIAHRDHREAELLVLVRGGNELVGAGVHAGGQAQHHVGALAGLAGQQCHALQLVQRVDDDAAQVGLQRGADLGDRLVVPVQRQVRRPERRRCGPPPSPRRSRCQGAGPRR